MTNDQVILRWESSDSILWDSSKEDIAEYLDSVDELIYQLDQHQHHDTLLQIAMGRLEDEFHHLLINADPKNSRSGCPNSISDMKEIADRMICAGYQKELSQVYITVRREILHEYLSVLGFEGISIEEVQQMDWKDLDDKIKNWILVLKIMVTVLTEEKTISDQIFAASEELSEECFALAANCIVQQILSFGDAISISPRSADRIFRIIEMHEALVDAIPVLRSLFFEDLVVCREADLITKRLGEMIRCIFMEFSNSVWKDDSRKPLEGGDVHPLTRYVMNYGKLLLEYKCSLDMILDVEHILEEVNKCGEDDQLAGDRTPLTRRLFLLISYLESNLEMKVKDYEDEGLQCIFMMNNLLYIVQKVQQSKLVTVFGDQWVRKRRGKVKRFATRYLRASWGKTWSYLMDAGWGGIRGRIFNASSKMAIKESFKCFNIGFEEIYRSQTSWKVSDLQLREELRISIAEMIIPAYRSFFGRFGSQLEGGRRAAKYVKYTPDELETCLSDFFEGLPVVSNHLMRRKLSFHHILASHG